MFKLIQLFFIAMCVLAIVPISWSAETPDVTTVNSADETVSQITPDAEFDSLVNAIADLGWGG